MGRCVFLGQVERVLVIAFRKHMTSHGLRTLHETLTVSLTQLNSESGSN